MEKIATDIYMFAELRNKGFTYVDKTDALYAMASGDVGKLFLSPVHAGSASRLRFPHILLVRKAYHR